MTKLSNMLLRFDHIVLYSSDPDRSLLFYSQLPGIKTGKEKGRGIARVGYQKLNIHSWPSMLSPLARNPVIGHQSFCIAAGDSSNRLQKYLQTKGIIVHADLWDCDSGLNPVGNSFYIEDPDGNRIRIVADESLHNQYRIINLSLVASDIQASAQFYQNILGMELQDCPNGFICQSGACQLVLRKKSDSLAAGNGDFCFLTTARIEDIHQLLPKDVLVQGMGIASRTGAMGPIRSVYLRDPDGNLVEIAEPVDKAAYFKNL